MKVATLPSRIFGFANALREAMLIPPMNRLIFLLTVAFTLCATESLRAQADASKTDPIVGHWIWNGNRNVTVEADGTAKQPGEASAEWKLLQTNNTVERKYEFIWHRRGGATYIHTVILQTDGKRLEGRNQLKTRIRAKRID